MKNTLEPEGLPAMPDDRLGLTRVWAHGCLIFLLAVLPTFSAAVDVAAGPRPGRTRESVGDSWWLVVFGALAVGLAVRAIVTAASGANAANPASREERAFADARVYIRWAWVWVFAMVAIGVWWLISGRVRLS